MSVPFIELVEGDPVVQDGLDTLVFRHELGVRTGSGLLEVVHLTSARKVILLIG